jgi:Spy/CpxP family protein refolding chaperone
MLLCAFCALLAIAVLAQGPPPPRDGTNPPPPRQDGQRPPRDGKGGGGQGGGYTLEQAMSDRAQLTTIAFSGLAFITGDFGAATFIPPGKVCDFFGFQYMRDIDAAQQGHNPAFMNRIVGNVFANLNDAQKAQFQALAAEQAPQFVAIAQMRYPLIKAFYRQLNGEIPAGSEGLNKAAVTKYVGDIFAKDAEMSYRRAEVMAKVYLSMNDAQKAAFAKMKFGDYSSWADVDEEAAKQSTRDHREPFYNIAYMTYLSEYFSWTAGSVDADTYFCPERHGTYFGGFYMKDMPAMGKRNYNISTSVTGDSGEAFVNQICTDDQRKILLAIPDQQRAALKEVATVRRQISVELRKFLAGGTPDKAKIVALGRRYGELDGEMSWYYTTAFAKVNKTLTADQKAALVKLRNLDGYTSAAVYLYSQPVQTAPALPNTDSFFVAPK